jgi:hypothetical protein
MGQILHLKSEIRNLKLNGPRFPISKLSGDGYFLKRGFTFFGDLFSLPPQFGVHCSPIRNFGLSR